MSDMKISDLPPGIDADGSESIPVVQGGVTKRLTLLQAMKALWVAGSSVMSFLQLGAGAVLRSLQAKLRESKSVTDFGADPTGVVDSTAACNAAHAAAGIGGTVFYPRGVYKIIGTVSMLAGQVIRGEGNSTVTNMFNVAGGSELRQYSGADIPCLQIVGADNDNQRERWGVEDIALTTNTPSSTVGTGFFANFARQGRMKNVYIAGFNTSKNFGPQCWQVLLQSVRSMDFAVGMINNSSAEDNCYITCQWAGYRPGSVPIMSVNQSANNLFLNCYLQACQIGSYMQQGDTSGAGTGTPFPMFATWIAPLIEDVTQAAFLLITSAQNAPSARHPGIRVISPRVLNTGLSGYMSSNTPSTSASGTGSLATIGFATQPVAPLVGTVTTITNMSPAGYNGSWVVVASTTSSVSFASTTTGAQTSAGTVIFGTTQYNAAPNNGQAIIYATHCSQVTLEQPMEGGFSYGVLSGVNAYGFFPSGTLPGPIDVRNVNGYIFGTAAAAGKMGSVTISPGDVQQVRLGTAQTSVPLSGSYGNPTFNVAVSNGWGWGDPTTGRITVPRQQSTRIFGAMVIPTTVDGAQYLLQITKNGDPLVPIASMTAKGTKAMVLSGDWRDVPTPTDYYELQIYCDSGSSVAITPAGTVFGAELVGT